MSLRRVVAAGVLMSVVAGCDAGGGREDGPGTPSVEASCGTDAPEGCGSGSPTRTPERSLAGRVVVLDPGHQLGNRNYAAQINAPVDAGGFTKACNTTGTATNEGYPEATLTWQIAGLVRSELRRQGARVLMTRERNSDQTWGPCIDKRGSLGNPGTPGPDADLRLSIHADGSLASNAHGFHVIRPGRVTGWTDDIVKPSRRFARLMAERLVVAGFVPSTYRGVGGIDVRTDLGTLNLSDVPAVMVELGNMRDPGDAATMTSRKGRQRYARALADGVVQTLAN